MYSNEIKHEKITSDLDLFSVVKVGGGPLLLSCIFPKTSEPKLFYLEENNLMAVFTSFMRP